MDDLTSLLDGPRARGAFLLRSTLEPPWAIRVEDHAPLTFVAVLRGSAWVVTDEGQAASMGAGAVAVVRGPGEYVIGDDPTSPPDVVVDEEQVCRTADGREVTMSVTGVRSWGNDPAGSTVMLTGTYQGVGEVSRRLLAALPPVATLAAGSWDNPLLAYLADEVCADGPGQQALLDRLLDALLLAALREWFSRDADRTPAWYLAQSDPVVGPALRMMHADPAAPWTVASLARAAGCSRATLARRFAEAVGEPPMSYLTGWRLSLAADLLREPGSTLAAVARRVGYSSPFALSTAFRRVRGVSPSGHRAATG